MAGDEDGRAFAFTPVIDKGRKKTTHEIKITKTMKRTNLTLKKTLQTSI